MVAIIRGVKGKKDIISLLSEKLLHILRKYYKKYNPQKYLFDGRNGGKYSPASVGNILRKAALKAGVRKKITPHMLRQWKS